MDARRSGPTRPPSLPNKRARSAPPRRRRQNQQPGEAKRINRSTGRIKTAAAKGRPRTGYRTAHAASQYPWSSELERADTGGSWEKRVAQESRKQVKIRRKIDKYDCQLQSAVENGRYLVDKLFQLRAQYKRERGRVNFPSALAPERPLQRWRQVPEPQQNQYNGEQHQPAVLPQSEIWVGRAKLAAYRQPLGADRATRPIPKPPPHRHSQLPTTSEAILYPALDNGRAIYVMGPGRSGAAALKSQSWSSKKSDATTPKTKSWTSGQRGKGTTLFVAKQQAQTRPQRRSPRERAVRIRSWQMDGLDFDSVGQQVEEGQQQKQQKQQVPRRSGAAKMKSRSSRSKRSDARTSKTQSWTSGQQRSDDTPRGRAVRRRSWQVDGFDAVEEEYPAEDEGGTRRGDEGARAGGGSATMALADTAAVIVKVQGLMRRKMARRRMVELMAGSRNSMLAMPGTIQGQTGWYESPTGQICEFEVSEGADGGRSWARVGEPLTDRRAWPARRREAAAVRARRREAGRR